MDPSHWQPLTYVDSRGNYVMQEFTAAHWCFVTPFALPFESSAASQAAGECPLPDEFRALLAPGPAKYGDPEYIAQAQELIDLSAHLTDCQKMIAEYWVDGFQGQYLQPLSKEIVPARAGGLTDPSLERSDASEPDATLIHWLQFAEYVSARDHHTLDGDIKMYFALSNALMDTSIATATAKRIYNSVRPITAITFLYKDKKIPARASLSADANPAQKRLPGTRAQRQLTAPSGCPTSPYPTPRRHLLNLCPPKAPIAPPPLAS